MSFGRCDINLASQKPINLVRMSFGNVTVVYGNSGSSTDELDLDQFTGQYLGFA